MTKINKIWTKIELFPIRAKDQAAWRIFEKNRLFSFLGKGVPSISDLCHGYGY